MKPIKSQSTIFVIYGATGDLSWRKLAPALYNLFLDQYMPEKFAIIGTSRSANTDEEFRAKLLEGVNKFSRSGKVNDIQWAEFSKHVVYQACDLKDAAGYTSLASGSVNMNQNGNRKPS